MVEKGAVSPVSHAHVGSALAHAAADGQKQQAAQQDPQRSSPPAVKAGGQGRGHDVAQQGVDDSCGQHGGQHGPHGIVHRHAGQCSTRLRHVVPDGAVELDAPKAIQTGVGHQGERHGRGHQADIGAVDDAQAVQPEPEAQAEQEPERCCGIARCGKVEGQSVPHDLCQLGGRHFAAHRCRLYVYEARLGQHEQQDNCSVEAGQRGCTNGLHRLGLGRDDGIDFA